MKTERRLFCEMDLISISIWMNMLVNRWKSKLPLSIRKTNTHTHSHTPTFEIPQNWTFQLMCLFLDGKFDTGSIKRTWLGLTLHSTFYLVYLIIPHLVGHYQFNISNLQSINVVTDKIESNDLIQWFSSFIDGHNIGTHNENQSICPILNFRLKQVQPCVPACLYTVCVLHCQYHPIHWIQIFWVLNSAFVYEAKELGLLYDLTFPSNLRLTLIFHSAVTISKKG